MKVEVQSWGSGFEHLADQLRDMLTEMHGRNYFRSHGSDTWKPNVNLYETHARVLICVELAGTPPEGIDVRADGGTLHIRGLRNKPVFPESNERDDTSDTVSVHQMEIDWGRFHRVLPIAPDVDVERIQAVYRQGFLWVVLPRTAE